MSDAATPYYRNDTWALEDGFGLGRAGDQVARMALEVDPPFVIGVTGKWGSGKTSVMRRAFVTLGGRPLRQPLMFSEDAEEDEASERWRYLDHSERAEDLGWDPDIRAVANAALCVWYSPWQHQNELNPLIPLIREIQAQFTAWHKIKEGAKAFNRQAGLAAARLLEHVTDAAISLVAQKPVQLARGLTDAVRSGWQAGEDGLASLSDGQRFHLLFEDAVKEVLKARSDDNQLIPGARLLIFVDDLDRCEGEVAVKLLEIVKLYLGTRHCVFVLGLDDNAVLDVLRKHRSDSEEGNREYLEKLFQAILPVPLPAERGVRKAVETQLACHGIPSAASARGALARDIELLLEPNPRKIKNFVNGLCAAWTMYGAGAWARGEEARRFVLYHYLRQYHRPVWRLLERQPWSLHLLWAVLNGASDADIDQTRLPGHRPDQRLLEEVFFRSFSHVLQTSDIDEQDRHGRESLEEAVRQFNYRRDRKRSDENFRILFRQLIRAETKLNPRHLYLPLDGRVAARTGSPGSEQ